MKFKINQVKADTVLLWIGAPFVVFFTVVMSLWFLCFLLFRLSVFLYAIVTMPLLFLLEKISCGQYKHPPLAEFWRKCFSNILDDWYDIMATIAS